MKYVLYYHILLIDHTNNIIVFCIQTKEPDQESMCVQIDVEM